MHSLSLCVCLAQHHQIIGIHDAISILVGNALLHIASFHSSFLFPQPSPVYNNIYQLSNIDPTSAGMSTASSTARPKITPRPSRPTNRLYASMTRIYKSCANGFRDTRLRILTLRPNSKVHWLTYALAVHATGDANGAVGVLDSYMDTLDKDCVELQRNFESSELAMYKNCVLAETNPQFGGAAAGGSGDDDDDNNDNDGLGGIRKALCHLDEIDNIVVDRTEWHMTKLPYQLYIYLLPLPVKTHNNVIIYRYQRAA